VSRRALDFRRRDQRSHGHGFIGRLASLARWCHPSR
jgi:hypothetical protein